MASQTTDSVKILLSADKQENIPHWTETLSSIVDIIWLDPSAIPKDQQPDVVITDGETAFDGDIGIIRVGSSGPADVNIPVQATPDELRLACRLLAEIVRLRRREKLNARLQVKLYAEALTDPLTSLPNRRAWDQTLIERLAQANNSHCLCMAIFDLDNFKIVNDSFGHAQGDLVLQQVGRAIHNSLRQDDFLARIGGDEFGLLIWLPEAAIATDVVERVRTALPQQLIKSGAQLITASVGVTVVSTNKPPILPSDIFDKADSALRRAKQAGRNQTAYLA